MLKNMRRAAVISATVALVGISVAPAAHAAKAPQPDLVWYLGSPDRSVVDLPPTGPSLGDITVTNGDVSELPGKVSIGFYSTNQTTVRVNIPGGREIRDVDLAISAPGAVRKEAVSGGRTILSGSANPATSKKRASPKIKEKPALFRLVFMILC